MDQCLCQNGSGGAVTSDIVGLLGDFLASSAPMRSAKDPRIDFLSNGHTIVW